jgi:quercetin dioxygenase-like cupin family protein
MANAVRKSDLTEDALYDEYMSAVNPHLPALPVKIYGSELHRTGATRVIPLDLSRELGGANGPATGPTVSAAYLRICKGESLPFGSNASAQLYYVIRGSGTSESEYGSISWKQGDVFVLPMSGPVKHAAEEDTALYHVTTRRS